MFAKLSFSASVAVSILATISNIGRCEPLKIVVVGLEHGHAEGFLRSRDKRNDIEVIGIVESNNEVSIDHAKRLGISRKLFSDNLEKTLDEKKPVACAVFTNNAAHLNVVKACASRGIHMMVDKPLAGTARDAREIADIVKRSKIHFVLDHGSSWSPAVHEIWRSVKERKEIGDIVQIYAFVGHIGPKELGVKSHFMDWLADPKRGGGALLDMSNGAGWAVWLMEGMPTTVTAVGTYAKKEKYPTVTSHNIVVLTYPNGATAVLQASWNQSHFRKTMDVYCEKGYVKMTGRDTVQIGKRTGTGSRINHEEAKELPALASAYKDRISHLRALIDGTISEPLPLASAELNAKAMEIMDAAQRSIDTGKTIQFDSQVEGP